MENQENNNGQLQIDQKYSFFSDDIHLSSKRHIIIRSEKGASHCNRFAVAL